MFLRQITLLMILCSAISVRAMEMDYVGAMEMDCPHSNKRSADSSWEQPLEKKLCVSERIIIWGRDGCIIGDEAILSISPVIFSQLQQLQQQQSQESPQLDFDISWQNLASIEKILAKLVETFGYEQVVHDINNYDITVFHKWASGLTAWFLAEIPQEHLEVLENAFAVLQLDSLRYFVGGMRANIAITQFVLQNRNLLDTTRPR